MTNSIHETIAAYNSQVIAYELAQAKLNKQITMRAMFSSYYRQAAKAIRASVDKTNLYAKSKAQSEAQRLEYRARKHEAVIISSL